VAEQGPPFRAAGIEERLLASKAVAQNFRIRVWQPVRRSDRAERFPVIYVTDADEYFATCVTLASAMQFHGECRRFMLVGIGYAESHAASLLRMRDFYAPEIRELLRPEIEAFARSPAGAGLAELRTIMQTTGAREFLQFIRDELKPAIESKYPCLPAESACFGYSSGGAFGLYTLFNEPETFRRYILGSPVVSFAGQPFAEQYARAFLNRAMRANAKLFLSAGEREDGQETLRRFQILSGLRRFTNFLATHPVAGLEVTSEIFPGEAHGSAWAPAFSHGVRTLFGPAGTVPFAEPDR
jgi:predicted alpha/beta superfamily hydrolase